MQAVNSSQNNALISYRIVEIFETLQGEGYNTGMPSIFIRFGKCNLACPWCDTNYHQYEEKTASEILSIVKQFSAKNIIITGGEPTIQPHLDILLDMLKNEGYFLAIETNGLKPVPLQIDYIATSPKRLYQKNYSKHHIPYADGEVNMLATITQLGLLNQRANKPHWHLSIQTHKIANID
ncbi:7-carboxy-7-deazaguanine synthase QueE [Otariodibacter oris]|uniref:7-carboxy-7-deazaguanine synthase n=1 Tax=Otariodibacter oris TaxID=1032623 RepID=A0A420XH27_9PAST|nr:7-carboxy-7-deazaguanine synthase QueE [Otariodibacter oris]QGM81107.1 radical SAM protein [Otariodibacter oris]RKR72659.1 organic radical activating enzyme [Otariodibacter oris]